MLLRVRPCTSGWAVFADGRRETPDPVRTSAPLRTSADALAHAKQLAAHLPDGATIAVYDEHDHLVSEFFFTKDEERTRPWDDEIPSIAASAPVTKPR